MKKLVLTKLKPVFWVYLSAFMMVIVLLGCPTPLGPDPVTPDPTPTPNFSVEISGGFSTISASMVPGDSFTVTPTSGFAEGATLTYTWRTLQGSTNVTRTGETTNQQTYTPWAHDVGTYTVEVRVSDGANLAIGTAEFTVTPVAGAAALTKEASGRTEIDIFREGNPGDQAWDPFVIVNRVGDLGNRNVSLADITVQDDGTDVLQVELKGFVSGGNDNGILLFGNGRPEVPIITGLDGWNIHFSAKASVAGSPISVLWGNGQFTTEGTDFLTYDDIELTTVWVDYTISGGTVADLALIIITSLNESPVTISIKDVYVEYNVPSVIISGPVSAEQNEEIIFTATPSNFDGTPTYAWAVRPAGSEDFVVIDGETNATLAYTVPADAPVGVARVRVTATQGSDVVVAETDLQIISAYYQGWGTEGNQWTITELVNDLRLQGTGGWGGATAGGFGTPTGFDLLDGTNVALGLTRVNMVFNTTTSVDIGFYDKPSVEEFHEANVNGFFVRIDEAGDDANVAFSTPQVFLLIDGVLSGPFNGSAMWHRQVNNPNWVVGARLRYDDGWKVDILIPSNPPMDHTINLPTTLPENVFDEGLFLSITRGALEVAQDMYIRRINGQLPRLNLAPGIAPAP